MLEPRLQGLFRASRPTVFWKYCAQNTGGWQVWWEVWLSRDVKVVFRESALHVKQIYQSLAAENGETPLRH